MSNDLVWRLRADELPNERQRHREARIVLGDLLSEAADRIEALEDTLRQCYEALEVAFDYDDDVFGIGHNDAVDAVFDAKEALGIK